MKAILTKNKLSVFIALIVILSGINVRGYAYTLTDKSWKKGSKDEDYQYVTQGFFITSNVVHSFTILTNTGDAAFIADKIEAVKSISYSK